MRTGVSSAVERADVLAVDEDVHERRELAVVEELRAERRIARDEVVEHVADGLAVRLELARAADLGAQRRRDANGGHQSRPIGALQNST